MTVLAGPEPRPLTEPAAHFDICGPLPGPGVTVLEASAGTGKTFTIAALVTRMVAEGLASLADILVVTFTRMATGELRERARHSLAAAEAGLAQVLAGPEGAPRTGPDASGDSRLLALLAGGSRQEVAQRHERLAAAVAGFDSATITTTHGFCHTVLQTLGTRGSVAEGATLLEDPADVVAQVVDDLLLRHAMGTGVMPFRRSVALKLAQAAVGNPGAPISPPPDRADSTPAGLRRRFAEGTRREVERRLSEANLLTYDGLLERLARALGPDERGEAACQRLRHRYRVVLVDEFQDTDQVQWDVVRRAFGDGSTTLVLVGDPKQAVYRFRGADVYAYLDAVRAAGPGRRFTLERNWRSDLGLLQAYNGLLNPLRLGHPEIVYRPALATSAHRRPGLRGAPVAAPLRARLVDRRSPWVQLTAKGLAQKGAAERLIADDLAQDVVKLLSSEAELVRWAPDGSTELGQGRPLTPGDIGVLVRANRQAAVVQAALRAAGVPAVVTGAESVLATPSAADWLSLLRALEQPASRSAAVAAALTPFIGMNAGSVARAGEQDWEQTHELLHNWAAHLRAYGVASLFAHITTSQGLPSRLLAELDGERRLTDLGHIAELLHAQALSDQLGLAALSGWLARRCGEGLTEGTQADQRSRRLDSGSDAVQLLTVHRAKGLEFPVVYCPFLWDGYLQEPFGGPAVFHDEEDGYRRKLDVGPGEAGPEYRRHFAAHQAEGRGEELRHLYVALTRAQHQAVIWWAGASGSEGSALARLLLCRDADGKVASDALRRVPSDEQLRKALEQVAGRAEGLVSIETCAKPGSSRWSPPTTGPASGELRVMGFARGIDEKWGRNSFTSVTSGAHQPDRASAIVTSEPETAWPLDEPLPGPGDGPAAEGVTSSPPAHPGRPSLLAGMPAGAQLGTFVHRVLERVDFSAPDLQGELLGALSQPELAYPGERDELPEVAQGLATAIECPLGPTVPEARLRDLRRRDRVDEMNFELPVAGGNEPWGQVSLADLARLWRAEVPADDVLAGYAEALESPSLAPSMRGYLTGSLDLVFRAPSPPGAEEPVRRPYFVADYKTNWLAPPGEELTSWHYRPEALAREMARAHYPLQALFYVVALHRYLRWRLPGYQPEVDLGGVLYLFLRGMACTRTDGAALPGKADANGPGPADTDGVFAWRPPLGLVLGLSKLLATGS